MILTKPKDLTSGNIYRQLILFSIPLLFGSIFQLLYNTTDYIIVGRYIGTEALAAVGATGPIVHILVYFFLGFSAGARVIVGQHFGVKDPDDIHEAVETIMAGTLVLCVILSLLGYLLSKPILSLLNTPQEVFDAALVYLKIYFLGISGLVVYDMGTQILNAVGNTVLPLMFLVVSNLLNILLDFVFVMVLGLGIEGVAYATVISQVLCAIAILVIMTTTSEVYRLTWKDIHINPSKLKEVLAISLPIGFQSVLTSTANLVALRFVSSFGAECIAAWGCLDKLLGIAMMPMGALTSATMAFVSQNYGAKQFARTHEGIRKTSYLTATISGAIALVMFIFAEFFTSIFTKDPMTIRYGAVFIRVIMPSMFYYPIGDNITGAMIGLGDSKGPVSIKLMFFVFFRIIYLVLVTNLISNTPVALALAYPISWGLGCIALLVYYNRRWRNMVRRTA